MGNKPSIIIISVVMVHFTILFSFTIDVVFVTPVAFFRFLEVSVCFGVSLKIEYLDNETHWKQNVHQSLFQLLSQFSLLYSDFTIDTVFVKLSRIIVFGVSLKVE